MEDKDLALIANCAMCANMCKYSCTVYLATGSETLTPQKKARLILYQEKQFLEDDRGFFDTMFQCAMCGACHANCIYENFDLRAFIQEERGEACRKDLLPEEVKKRLQITRQYGNPDGERELIQKGSGEIGYFVSCSTFRDKAVLSASEDILRRSRLDIQEFGGADICCGAPFYFAGDNEELVKVAKRIGQEVKKRNLKKIITNCPTCVQMMTKIYDRIGVHLDAEFIHMTEFLCQLLTEGKIQMRKKNGLVTYHDPCTLARDIGIIESPRDIIKAMGFEIREPVYSGKDTHCCGRTPGQIASNTVRGRVSEMRIGELKETAAEAYISACPTCKKTFGEMNFNMKDITEIVAESISDE